MSQHQDWSSKYQYWSTTIAQCIGAISQETKLQNLLFVDVDANVVLRHRQDVVQESRMIQELNHKAS